MYIKLLSSLPQLICLAIILRNAQAKMVASITKIECLVYIPGIVSNFSCYVNQTSQDTGTFSVEVYLAEDLHELKGHYTLSIKRGSSITEIMSTKIDYCRILASAQSDYLLRMFTAEVRRVSNIPLECPFIKNKRYYIKEFTLNTKMIPSYLPKLDFISDTLVNYKNYKGFRAIIYGSLVRK